MASGRRWRGGRVELGAGLLALALIVGAGTALAARRAAPVEPGLVVEAGGLDFGTAWEQPAFRHAFTVRNPGGRPVRVAEIKTGCGCTTVEPQGFTVPPGGSQELVATLDLSGRARGKASGFRVELQPVLGHEPPGRRTVWPLKGEVRPHPLRLSESAVDFGDDVIVGEAPPTRAVEVELGQAAADGELAATARNGASVEAERVGPRRWRVDIAPPAGLPAGPFEFDVNVAVRDSDPAIVRTVRAAGAVREDIAAWPAAVNFGAIGIGETGREYVVLASHRGRPFEVTRVEAAEGTTVAPAAEQIGDSSRTFFVEQAVTKSGLAIGRITFHIESADSAGALPNRITIQLETKLYGTTTRP